ncbi:hypothetical protein OG389_06040 [Streptomyces sp. NBC_00435]|uniref:hypothetical protein n=1 Tax=Streptomyces sp. NBC_00435 TaxID=2903649 RepID=UPI002E1BAC7D
MSNYYDPVGDAYEDFLALYPHLEEQVKKERYAALYRIAEGVLQAEAPVVDFGDWPGVRYQSAMAKPEAGYRGAMHNLMNRLIARSVANPNQITQQSTGDASYSVSPGNGMGMRLTAAERQELARIFGQQFRTVWLA